jgi:hypothetical protein
MLSLDMYVGCVFSCAVTIRDTYQTATCLQCIKVENVIQGHAIGNMTKSLKVKVK